MDLLSGKVSRIKFYNKERQFGYLIDNTFVSGHYLVELAFNCEIVEIPPKEHPKKGKEVIYIPEPSDKGGIRAMKWAIFNQDRVERWKKEAENYPLYRLVRRKGHKLATRLWGGCEITELWRGKSVKQMPDEMLFECDDSAIYFEVLKDKWERCDDPRINV